MCIQETTQIQLWQFIPPYRCKWAKYNGVSYRENEGLVVLPEDRWEVPDEPLFARVLGVATIHGQVKLITQAARIHQHLHHYHTYTIASTNIIHIIDTKELTHPHPLHIYRISGTQHTNAVIPKYHISIL